MAFQVKTYTKVELAAMYNVTSRTFYSWTKNIPGYTIKKTRILTPKEVQLIISHLGEP